MNKIKLKEFNNISIFGGIPGAGMSSSVKRGMINKFPNAICIDLKSEDHAELVNMINLNNKRGV